MGIGIGRVARLTWNRLLMSVDNSAEKGTPGKDKFGSVIDRMHEHEAWQGSLLFENQNPAP